MAPVRGAKKLETAALAYLTLFLVAPLGTSYGNPGFLGPPVEKHWLKPIFGDGLALLLRNKLAIATKK